MASIYTSDNRSELRKEAGLWLEERRIMTSKPENKCGHLVLKDIAEAIGTESASYISNIEAGGPRVPPDRYREWADVIQVPRPEFTKRMLYWYEPDLYDDLFADRQERREDFKPELDRAVK